MKKLILLTACLILTSCQIPPDSEPINQKIDAIKIGNTKAELINTLGDYRQIQYLDKDTTIITYFLTNGFLKDGVRLDYKLSKNTVSEINISKDIAVQKY
jgi:hypothetical protein